MSAGHTPGPWACTTRRGSWDWVVYCEADPNIEICQPFHDGTEFNETGEANSRLIAAAPELLENAQEALRHLRAMRIHRGTKGGCCGQCGKTWDGDEEQHHDSCLIKRVTATIAKATATPYPLPNPDNQMPGGRVK